MTELPSLPSDRDLVAAARAGSDAAWDELRRRHLAALRDVARAAELPSGERRVDDAFARVRTALADPLPEPADDEPAVRAIRPLVIAALTGGIYGPSGPDTARPDSSPAHPSNPAADLTPAELDRIATAFARLPEAWQAVLWHRLVERAPAATVAVMLGRRTADVLTLEQAARRGLFDACCAVELTAGPQPRPLCRPILGLLGGHRRNTLSAAHERAVLRHLDGAAPGDPTTSAGCPDCRRRLALGDRLAELIPFAVAPALTGMSVDDYRSAIGAFATAAGVKTLAAQRSKRMNRVARVSAIAAVVAAVLAAATLIRAPFGDLNGDLADLADPPATTSTAPPPTDPSQAPTTTATDATPSALASRIELAFPGPVGVIYVPGEERALDLSIGLATPGPVFAGGTGTIDLALTNNDTVTATTSFRILTSAALSFDRQTEGGGSCTTGTDGAPSCSIVIEPGGTVPMSLRFDVDADGPDRLVVDPGVASPSLEVPVETLPDLLIGTIERGDLAVVGGPLGCAPDTTCADGRSGGSSADLDIAADRPIVRALLTWEGDDPTSTSADRVVLAAPRGDGPSTIEAELLPTARQATSGFRAVADVTAIVRAAGGGTYEVSPPDGAPATNGSWTLVVIVGDAQGPRRLLVATAPPTTVVAGGSGTVDIPVSGSRVPLTSTRTGRLIVQDVAVGDPADVGVTADGAPVVTGETIMLASDGERAAVNSYDLEIASTTDALSITTSTASGAPGVTAVSVSLDIVS